MTAGSMTGSGPQRVRHFPPNEGGRDFVVGDIHGEFSRVQEALDALRFDPQVDRLFCTGDLIDRGPCSSAVLEWLNRPWFHSVRGNHEDMLLSAGGDTTKLAWWLRCNGGEWWLAVDEQQRRACLAAFEALPLALDIDVGRGRVGILHADAPPWLDWAGLCGALTAGDRDLQQYVLWERRRISFMDRQTVAGIIKIYCGHTPLARPRLLGNVHFIDTGICYGGEVMILPLAP